MTTNAATTTHQQTNTATRHGPALAAALLGIVVLFVAGFAPLSAVHNAAHDSRHSIAVPCH